MTAVADVVSYREASGEDRFRSLSLSHLSIEVGHFYMDELLNGEDPIRARFAAVVPWIAAARASVRADRPRVSTCFLVDDYFYPHTNPAVVMPRLLSAAADSGVEIDYIAREAACDRADGVDVATLVAERLVEEPAPKATNGSRPPATQSGWLSNGRRSEPEGSGQAMRDTSWEPPQEFGKRKHSIFLDVEMWRDEGERLWSCPFLAGVWYLLRLGALRNYDRPVAVPRLRAPDEEWPSSWDDLPAVMQMRENAPPFSAFRAVSILPHAYLPIEHAIRVVLGQLHLDEPVIDDVVARGAQERIVVPRSITERISHVFIDG
jgi:hypothetical protein